MNTIWIFSKTDNSIDLLGAVIFICVLYLAARNLYRNHLTIQGKILYSMVGIISLLHVVQVSLQLSGFGPNQLTMRTWDIINYMTAMAFMMGVARIAIREVEKKG